MVPNKILDKKEKIILIISTYIIDKILLKDFIFLPIDYLSINKRSSVNI